MFRKKTKKKSSKPGETFPESIAGIASVLVSGLFIITFVVQAFEIPSSSMEDTLLIGDHVFVDRLIPASKAPYLGPLMPYSKLHHGDIVVFLSPSSNDPGLYVVKRVMGTPGDHIHLKEGEVYRNGEKLNEPYVKHTRGGLDLYRDYFPAYSPDGVANITAEWPAVLRANIKDGELVVPPNCYFVMGDNRDDSMDSRYWGFVPQENVIGRPLFTYWSFDTPAGQYQKTSMGERVQFVLHVIIHFFDKTRWSRMFHLVH